MKKVISFSVWGDNTKYLSGINENIKLVKQYYSDYECWFYIHEPTVPKHIIELINNYDNCKIIYKNDSLQKGKPMMWRFEAIDDPDVEIMLSRDLDSRIYEREVIAVNEWLQSGKLFHIMRDHPLHHKCYILGGMFGTKKNNKIPSWIHLIKNYNQNGDWGYDQNFLRDIIYPVIASDVMIHSSSITYPNEIIHPFIKYDSDFKFVGENIDSNGNGNIKVRKEIEDYMKKKLMSR
jgi:hypothetical protein